MDPNHEAGTAHANGPDCPVCATLNDIDLMFADEATTACLTWDIVHVADGLDPASPLATLMGEANRLAASSEDHFRSAREHILDGLKDAVAVGAHLAAIHDQLHHGQWLPWLHENFCQSQARAYDYLTLWDERVLVGHYLKLQSPVTLTASIDGALQFIRAKRAEAKLLATPPKPVRPEYNPFPGLTESLLDIAALAEKLMDVSPPEEWWLAIKENAWRFKKEPDRDFWRRFGEGIIAMSEAPDPPDEEDIADWMDLSSIKRESQYGLFTAVFVHETEPPTDTTEAPC